MPNEESCFCYDIMSARPRWVYFNYAFSGFGSISIRNLPQINVLTKKDLLCEEKLERIMEWIEDNDQLDYATES